MNYRLVEREKILLRLLDGGSITEQLDSNFERALIKHRDREIMKMRLLRNMTLQQIGDRYGITRERVRQIEARVLTVLTHDPRI